MEESSELQVVIPRIVGKHALEVTDDNEKTADNEWTLKHSVDAAGYNVKGVRPHKPLAESPPKATMINALVR